MVEPTESEIVEVDKETTNLSEIQIVTREQTEAPTRGVVTGDGDNTVTGANGNAVTGGDGNAATGAQGVPRTFFTWLVRLFAGDALSNDSEQEALLGNLSSFIHGELPLSFGPGGGNGVGAGGGNGVGAGGGNGVGAGGGNGVGAGGGNGVGAGGGNGVGAGGGNGVGAGGGNGVGAPSGGWFRRIWRSRRREGPHDIEAGRAAPETTARVAPGGGWFRRRISGSRRREGSNDVESGSAAPVPPIAVSVMKDSWNEFLGEANDFIKWIIMECFLFVPVKYLLKGDDPVPSTLSLSAFQLELPTLFLPTVFSYATCILGSKMFKSSKIKTTFQVFGILLGVVACLEAFFFVGYDAHISVTIFMIVILVAISIAKCCD